MDPKRPDWDRRCWPCTVANLAVGVLVAWVPASAVLLVGNPDSVPVAVAWGGAVTAFTVYRLAGRGHLPLAERVARVTGLHDRISPGASSAGPERRDREEQSGPGDDEDRSG